MKIDINYSNLTENEKYLLSKIEEMQQHFKQNITEMSKVINVLKNESPKQSSIPIGFLYTQLSNQSEPQKLWPNTVWTEVTKQYSGLFFRAEGGNALPFGEIQQQNYSTISDIKSVNYCLEKVSNGDDLILIQNVPEGKWSDNIVEKRANCPLGSKPGLTPMYIFKTSGENRPI